MKTAHTPTPWRLLDILGGVSIYAWDMEQTTDRQILSYRDPSPPSKANAAFIVKAVNCHDELVEALERELAYWNNCAMRCANLSIENWQVKEIEARRASINAALAKAKGEI